MASITLHQNLLFLTILSSFFLVSSSQSCSNYTFNSNQIFSSCADLPYLDAHLHWNYTPYVRKVSLAFRARQTPQGWVAWGINPYATGMVGCHALVAFRASNGSMIAYTASITSYDPPLTPAKVGFRVSGLSAEYVNDEMIIFATVGPLRNGSVVNQVWQVGDSVYGNIPQPHSIAPSNLESMGEIDFLMYLS